MVPLARPGHDRRMRMHAELVVSAPQADAWAVIGDGFADIADWASAVTRSAANWPPGPGVVRTCRVAGFGPIAPAVMKERLVRFDATARSLSYEAIAGLPWFVVRATSDWSVHDAQDEKCVIRIQATLTLRPAARPLTPALRWRMRADTRRTLAELKHRIETGRPHPGKVAALTCHDGSP